MKNGYEEVAQRLVECLAPINDAVEAQILARMCAEDGYVASYQFAITADTVRQLAEVLARDGTSYAELRAAVAASRQSPSRLAVVQGALAVARLQGQLQLLEASPDPLSFKQRQQFRQYLNDFDGDLGLRRDAGDARGLIARINEQAGVPIVDALLLRGLAHVFAEHPPVWNMFRCLVEALASAPAPANVARGRVQPGE